MKIRSVQIAFLIFGLISILSVFLNSCASSTEQGDVGVSRGQLLLVPQEQIVQESQKAYSQTMQEAQSKGLLNRNNEQVLRVRAIAKKLIPYTKVFRKDAPGWSWEVNVISSPEINAYCMPGGKIVFYTGIIEKLSMTDDEIAAIMGHEMAHALREHGRERMSEELLKQLSLQALVAAGKINKTQAQLTMALSSVFVSLPHGRTQETEADEMGLEMMARAGYNPEGAVTLWKKMSQQGGGKPPEILSTHPSDQNRINNLTRLLPKVMPLYQATVSGK
jgi:predicted Zn-dependent protease